MSARVQDYDYFYAWALDSDQRSEHWGKGRLNRYFNKIPWAVWA